MNVPVSDAASISTRPGSTAFEPGDAAPVRIESLHLHPVKSCAGFAVTEALLVETGFDLDRTWMVTDPDGVFVSQRELPRMALVQTRLRGDELVLRAPGMLALHVAVERVEVATRAVVWNDRVAAYDMGPLAAQWFTDFLGRPLRLVRFDPEGRRLADAAWTGDLEAETAFQDGFPLLVASSASLDALNDRLAAVGEPAATWQRFRPNVVVSGLDANGEDHLHEIAFDSEGGPIRVRLVKPCARCPIPDVDPETGERGHAVGDALRGYRADPRSGGAITFAMNAVIVEGIDRTLRVGDVGRATLGFA